MNTNLSPPGQTADRRASPPDLRVVVVVAGLLAGSVWSLLERFVGLPGGALPADLLVAGSVSAMAWLALRELPRSDGLHRALALDALIVTGATAVVVWLLAGRSMMNDVGAGASGVVAVVAPAFDAGVLMVAFALVLRRRGATRRTCDPGPVALALGLVLVGDLARLAWRSATVADAVSLLAVGAWTAAALVMFRGCRAARLAPAMTPSRRTRRRTLAISNATERRLRDHLVASLPAAPVVAAATAAVAGSLDALLFDRIDPVVAAALTLSIALVLVRQHVALVDNDQMGERLRQRVDELEQQARHDPLTMLPNRSGLEQRIRDAQDRASQRGEFVGVLFIDLDHLKTVNDTLGHSAGDRLIVALAQRFLARVGDAVTRFGGDEFVILLDDVPTTDAAVALATSLVGDASTPLRVAEQELQPSISIGVAIGDGGLAPDELLRRADVALYRAKSNGRRRVEVAGADDDEHRHRLELRHELRRAVREGEFRVRYQPMVELATGRVVGAETLVRWQHPERGLLSPEAFLDEAAAAGLLPAIGAGTFSTVAADLAQTRLAVSVNLSTSELLDASLVARLTAELERHSVDPRRLTIEITEDVVVDRAVQRAIGGLRALGVGIAIDDFGTGNSSLRQLGSYPADVLKIDRSFVDRIAESHEALAVTRAIVRMAHELGLKTVAEGVETVAQATLLVELGCEYAQGWLFARPMSLAELVAQHPPGARLGTSYPVSRSKVASASSISRSSSSATGGRSSIAPTT